MSRALFIASTGMHAQERKIETSANNLSNMNTDAFKRSDARFSDLMYQTLRSAGVRTANDSVAPASMQVGLGTKLNSIVRDFTPGAARYTGGEFDLMVEGTGFLGVLRNGEVLYTRNGSALRADAEGRLTTSDGHPLHPEIRIPDGTRNIEISAEGVVTAILREDASLEQIGRLTLYTIPNQTGLDALGRNLFRVSPEYEVDVREGFPGEEGFGTISQGYVESSNVNVVEEMVGMISSQRAYEANSRVIQTTDRMMEEANRLR